MKTISFDDPTAGPTVFVAAIGVIVFTAAVFALQGYYGRVLEEELEIKNTPRTSGQYEGVRTERLERMTKYEWLDADAGAVAIPIDRAIDLVIEELAQQPEPGL